MYIYGESLAPTDRSAGFSDQPHHTPTPFDALQDVLQTTYTKQFIAGIACISRFLISWDSAIGNSSRYQSPYFTASVEKMFPLGKIDIATNDWRPLRDLG